MLYLNSFRLPTDGDELEFLLKSVKLDMAYYSGTSSYPFKIFPQKQLSRISFEPITVFYGTNGSGKSTLLNIIAEKLGLRRTAPFNDSPFFSDYLAKCRYTTERDRPIPQESSIITSDGVFDTILDVRGFNKGVVRRRREASDEYFETKRDLEQNGWQLKSLDDYEELKRRQEIRRGTSSQYIANRMPAFEINTRSNGENAYRYFTEKITENALFLLDEPENSLSASLQKELAQFLEDSARFYNCQLIISTHSPFILSLKGARVYDLDSSPAEVREWSELENVREYFELFERHRKEFL